MLTLHHPAHDRLRRENPRAAEELALAVVRTLSEPFDLLDKETGSGTGPILLSQASFLLAHNSGPVPLSASCPYCQ